jgi:1-acyl-sn-glycerol-3-phosphate acyltransferase
MEKPKKIAPLVRYVIPPIINLWINKVSGLENLPRGKPFIIAPNHSSYMEHLMISCIVIPYINKKLYFIAKKEHFEGVSQKSWHGIWTRCIGYIPIDRSKGEKALKKANSYLKKGEVIVIYPEGTRTLTGKIQEGKTGVARLALWSGVPVIPLGIKGTFEILPKGKTIPKFKKATLKFGKPLYFDKYYDKPLTRRLLRSITRTLMKQIAKLAGQKYRF